MSSRSSQRALFILLLGSLFIVARVFLPLATALVLGAVLAAALWPVQRRLAVALRGRSGLAAGLILFWVVVLVLAPLVGLSAFIVRQATDTARFVTETVQSEGAEGLVAKLPDSIEGYTRQLLARLSPNGGIEEAVQQQVSERGGQAAAVVGSVVSTTGSFLFHSVMMLIAFFFFLTNKEAILDWIEEASPLERRQTHELLREFRNVSVAVLRSTVLTALAQAVAAFVGYLIAKVPYPVFFGAVTFFVAMIPAVGAAAVCLAVALLMLIAGHSLAALFLAIWGIVVVGLSDNLVKPMLIKQGVGMHGAVVFFALLGGLAAFGAVGLLLGPLAVALFIAALRIYRRDYGETPLPPSAPSPAPRTHSLEPAGRLVPREV